MYVCVCVLVCMYVCVCVCMYCVCSSSVRTASEFIMDVEFEIREEADITFY